MKLIARAKRAATLYKHLSYGGTSWWVEVGGMSHTIIQDKGFYYYQKKKVRIFFRKIRVSWTLAYWHILTNDGLYDILKEGKELTLYKRNY